MYMFVDGACSGNNTKNKSKRKAGCGVYFGDNDARNVSMCLDESFVLKFDLEGLSNQVAEIAAVYFGLNELLISDSRSPIQGEYVVIYTDSSYVENVFTKWVFDWKENGWKKKTYPFTTPKNWKLIREVDDMLNEVIEKYNVSIRFVHVSAHQTAPRDKDSEEYFLWCGNNEADQLARRGARSSN